MGTLTDGIPLHNVLMEMNEKLRRRSKGSFFIFYFF